MTPDVEIRSDRPVPEDEIEVRPEMIEAGFNEVWKHEFKYYRETDLKAAVDAIYRAMFASRL